jgi:hypothetical protein
MSRTSYIQWNDDADVCFVLDQQAMFQLKLNCINGVMVSVLTWGVVDCSFEPRSGQIKDYKIVFTASLLSTNLYWVRGKTG